MSKPLSKRQLMAYKARKMQGRKCSFRLDAQDKTSRVSGTIIKAAYGGIHEPSGLHSFAVTIQGRSGRTVEINSNENFLTLE